MTPQVHTDTDQIRDPVSRVRMTFERQADNLMVDCWVEPGGGLPPHLHPLQEERWSVVDGAVDFRLGDREFRITPDDGEIVVTRGTVHGITSIDADSDAHLHCLVVPALHLQEFLEESARAAREGLFTQRGLPRGLRGTRWVAGFLKRYRNETVFLSPPASAQRLLIAIFARSA